MPKPEILPRYPQEWWRFVRDPVGYLEHARSGDAPDAYSPLKAFFSGLALVVAIEAYEAHRWSGIYNKGAETLTIIFVLAAASALMHRLCRAFGGHASAAETAMAFEYIYGYLLPATLGFLSILMATADIVPGLQVRFAIDQIEFWTVPTTANLVVVALGRTMLLGGIVYVFCVISYCLARLHGIAVWRGTVSYLITLAGMAVIGYPLYRLSYWIAARFSQFVEIVG